MIIKIEKGERMSRVVALNTLAYQQVFSENKDCSQADVLKELKSAGFQYVEVRREYFKNGQAEMDRITDISREQQLTLFYSVPDELFKENKLNPAVEGYFEEAKQLQAVQVKLTLGDLNDLTRLHANQIAALLESTGIKLVIENDQTKEKGSANKLKAVMEQAAQHGLPIGVTFDTGNFVYINENPVESAQQLKSFVHYIHIKNVQKTDTGIEVTDIESGDLPIQDILREFPETVPCAIEYPCGEQDRIIEKLLHERNLLVERFGR